jgi:hypothetical protein
MARRLFALSAYPAIAVFILMGLAGAVLAWSSFDLVRLAMANWRLVGSYGLAGLMDGGLLQAVGIVGRAALALASYLVFKAAEVELVGRWRNFK